MKGKLGDVVRLRHVLDAINEVELYLQGIDFDSFVANSEKRFATLKQIEIIGEACNALTDESKASYSFIPWKPIIAFRNISIHEYFGINLNLVWEIATNDLPDLKKQIAKMLDEMTIVK